MFKKSTKMHEVEHGSKLPSAIKVLLNSLGAYLGTLRGDTKGDIDLLQISILFKLTP